MNSFSFTLSGKHLINPSILNESFAGQSNLGCTSLFFITWNTYCQSLRAYKVSFEKSVDSLMGTPFQVIICFSLVAFKILSLSLTFGILTMMCLAVDLFALICLGLSVLPGLACLFLSKTRNVFFHYFFKQVPNTLKVVPEAAYVIPTFLDSFFFLLF